MRSPLVQLLTARRFAPLFVTQFLGAFNDNLLKSAMGIVVTFRLAEQSGLDSASLVMLAGAVFIAPFFLFSGASGTLADRIDKSLIARLVKVAEIAIMTLGAGRSVARKRTAPLRGALLPRHPLDRLRPHQVRPAAAAPARRRAGRGQRPHRGRHVPGDPVRHHPRRQRRPPRQGLAHRRRLRRCLCGTGLAGRACRFRRRPHPQPMLRARACWLTRSPSSAT